ncbi:MAG TPA: hypothetical protein VNO50_11945 [Pyrinomonadaceae bacterium]|nr:hypothetical protein [Pyrinomonadaceae bacterium]
MSEDWNPRETTTHQDHVIAHVVGTSVLGHIVVDQALYLLLDIGFIWIVFLDGEMGLLPHPVAIGELVADEPLKQQLKTDIDVLLSGDAHEGLKQLIETPSESQITEVSFFERADQRRLLIIGDEAGLGIETSLTTAEIHVYEL